MLTVLLAIAGVALAMGAIGLGVMLRKRTPLRRSCHGSGTGAGESAEHCEVCGCDASGSERFDEP